MEGFLQARVYAGDDEESRNGPWCDPRWFSVHRNLLSIVPEIADKANAPKKKKEKKGKKARQPDEGVPPEDLMLIEQPINLRLVTDVVDENPNDLWFAIGLSVTEPLFVGVQTDEDEDVHVEYDYVVDPDKEFPGLENVRDVQYLELRAETLKEKYAWLRCLEVFDKMTYDPEPLVDPEPEALEHSGLTLEEYDKANPIDVPKIELEAMFICLNFIEDQGLRTANIFRSPGSATDSRRLVLDLLVDQLDFVPAGYDVLVVASALKLLMRRCPESVLTNVMFDRFVAAADAHDLRAMTGLVSLLPDASRDVLARLAKISEEISANMQYTKMDINGLAIVIGPNLLPDTNDPTQLRDVVNTLPHLYDLLISCFNYVFHPEYVDDEFAEELELAMQDEVVHVEAPPEEEQVGERVLTVSESAVRQSMRIASERGIKPAQQRPKGLGMFGSLSVAEPDDDPQFLYQRSPNEEAMTLRQAAGLEPAVHTKHGITSPMFTSPVLAGPALLGLSIMRQVMREDAPPPIPTENTTNFGPFVGMVRSMPYGQALAFSDDIPEEIHPTKEELAAQRAEEAMGAELLVVDDNPGNRVCGGGLSGINFVEIDMPEEEEAQGYMGPDLSLPKALAMWRAIEALRKHLDKVKAEERKLELEVNELRYKAEWEDAHQDGRRVYERERPTLVDRAVQVPDKADVDEVRRELEAEAVSVESGAGGDMGTQVGGGELRGGARTLESSASEGEEWDVVADLVCVLRGGGEDPSSSSGEEVQFEEVREVDDDGEEEEEEEEEDEEEEEESSDEDDEEDDESKASEAEDAGEPAPYGDTRVHLDRLGRSHLELHDALPPTSTTRQNTTDGQELAFALHKSASYADHIDWRRRRIMYFTRRLEELNELKQTMIMREEARREQEADEAELMRLLQEEDDDMAEAARIKALQLRAAVRAKEAAAYDVEEDEDVEESDLVQQLEGLSTGGTHVEEVGAELENGPQFGGMDPLGVGVVEQVKMRGEPQAEEDDEDDGDSWLGDDTEQSSASSEEAAPSSSSEESEEVDPDEEIHNLLKDASILEQYIAARRYDLEARLQRRQERELELAAKRKQELREEAERYARLQARLQAKERKRKAKEMRLREMVRPTTIERHPQRRMYEREASKLAAHRAYVEDLKTQMQRLLLDLESLMMYSEWGVGRDTLDVQQQRAENRAKAEARLMQSSDDEQPLRNEA